MADKIIDLNKNKAVIKAGKKLTDSGTLDAVTNAATSGLDPVTKAAVKYGVKKTKSKVKQADKKQKKAVKAAATTEATDGRDLKYALGNYAIPIGAGILRTVGDVASAQQLILPRILQGLANSQSNAQRAQHGANIFATTAAMLGPLSDTRAYATKLATNRGADMAESLGNKMMLESLYNDALNRRQVLMQPIQNMSSSQWDAIARNESGVSKLETMMRDTNASGADYTMPTAVWSDERIKDIMSRTGKFTNDDVSYLVSIVGNMDDEHDFNADGDNWDNSVLDKYAEHIQNYLYTYKPEAQNIDPSIDPNQKQIGPMAQDIEHVNPSCIKETEEGVKTVDTGRLALMNAGAIADLAREVKEIKEMLNGQ